MTYILINCTSTGRAQDVETAANAGQLWGVDMGTTSKAASYGNYALIECSKTRNLALIDAMPQPEHDQGAVLRNLRAILDVSSA